MADGTNQTPSFLAIAREIVTPALPVVEAYGEHCQGIASANDPCLGGPFTRITRGRSWYEGGEFIANVDGHLPDGAVHEIASHGRGYRLKLVTRHPFPKLALKPEPGEIVRNHGGAL